MKKHSFRLFFAFLVLLVVLVGCDSEGFRRYVRFNANGGVLNCAAYVRINEDGKIDEPAVRKDYSTFVGWFESPDFSGRAWDFGKDVSDPDSKVVLQLYAKWDPQFVLEGGSIGWNKDSSFQLPKNLVIPSSLEEEAVTRLRYEGFNGNTTIETVKIPSSIESIGSSCFEGCSNLSMIEFAGSYDKWDSIVKGEGWNDGIPTGAKLICTDKEVSL